MFPQPWDKDKHNSCHAPECATIQAVHRHRSAHITWNSMDLERELLGDRGAAVPEAGVADST